MELKRHGKRRLTVSVKSTVDLAGQRLTHHAQQSCSDHLLLQNKRPPTHSQQPSTSEKRKPTGQATCCWETCQYDRSRTHHRSGQHCRIRGVSQQSSKPALRESILVTVDTSATTNRKSSVATTHRKVMRTTVIRDARCVAVQTAGKSRLASFRPFQI